MQGYGGTFIGEAGGFARFDDLSGESVEFALQVEETAFFQGEGCLG
jgi:hypothetical protein